MELLIALENFEETKPIYENFTENEEAAKQKTLFEKQEQIRSEEVQRAKTQDQNVSKNFESKYDCTSRAEPHGYAIANMSSLELIFLGYAKQLQKMPLALQLSTKRKIADIMDEAELHVLNN